MDAVKVKKEMRAHQIWGMNACMLSHFSRVQLFVTPWTEACQAPLSMETSGKNTGVGCGFPFATPGDLPDPWIEP